MDPGPLRGHGDCEKEQWVGRIGAYAVKKFITRLFKRSLASIFAALRLTTILILLHGCEQGAGGRTPPEARHHLNIPQWRAPDGNIMRGEFNEGASPFLKKGLSAWRNTFISPYRGMINILNHSK
jgi:hypothetical protein